MVEVNWSRQAIEDIHEIREYYRPKSERYAEEFTDKVFEKAVYLEQHPHMGRMVPELERADIRELIYKNYRIIYRVVSEERIDILVVHNGLRPLTERSIFG